MTITEKKHVSAEALTAALADMIQSELTAAVADRGHASLVVSGGSTPKPLFLELSLRPLPWSKITVTLADERWVDNTSEASNEAMLRQTLLRNAAAEAHFVPMKNKAATPKDGLAECEQAISSIALPFDLVILGMGEDAHTASLFPHVAGDAYNRDHPDLCAAVTPETAPHQRMSLTAAALLKSRKIVLHIVGDNKWQVYENASLEGPVEALPIRTVLHQDRVPVEVFWSA